ncbi:hypothetical protein ZIOFF_062120 [Zingiber officinale]|uniref:Uncharacterized protein n=1 Tax=Zingiber officinale TaxID=94328 RepID=A0A8J5KAI7_ZINOF|nr:hypothetical protein ZIOFF_062120 [Zingiber officinale]
MAQKIGKSFRRPGTPSLAQVYADNNVKHPKNYWDYESLNVQCGNHLWHCYETVDQYGVIFLRFCFGLGILHKIRVVRVVTIGGGFLQMLLFMCLCGVIAVKATIGRYKKACNETPRTIGSIKELEKLGPKKGVIG